MNYFDLIVIVPLLWGAFKGFKNGLIIEASSFAALFLGVYGAIKFSGYISSLIIKHFDIKDSLLPIISFAITFIAIVICVHLLAKLLDKLIKAVALGIINRIAGIVFGILKFLIIISLVVLILDRLNSKLNFMDPALIADSFFYTPLVSLSQFVFQGIEI